MNDTLRNLLGELNELVNAVNSLPSNEPFSIAHNNWSFPGVSKFDLLRAATELREQLSMCDVDNFGSYEAEIIDYIRRINYLRTQTVPNIWNNPVPGVSAYFTTLDTFRALLKPVLQPVTATAKELDIKISELGKTAATVATKLRALEARLRETEPRTATLQAMVERIESAYQAADQLPADLQSLAEDRAAIQQLLKLAQDDQVGLAKDKSDSTEIMGNLKIKWNEAENVLKLCHSAYAAATSHGLATAFSDRSKSLATSMWVWTAAFVIALGTGAYFGSNRIHEIGELLKNPVLTNWILAINLLLAALSVGAPIWFGWMAAKQINQRFRLSEDYAFKAAVSTAYEGYRREAARIDEDLEARLLESALTRFDEQPLRLVESSSHGTPLHELLSSKAVKTALQSVPGFADKLIEISREAVTRRNSDKEKQKDQNDIVAASNEGTDK